MPAAPRLSPGAPKPTNGQHLGRHAPPLGARAIVCARTAPGKTLRAAEAAHTARRSRPSSTRLFNDARINEAVLGFKRYEDASLAYAGIDRHAGETLGGW